MKRAALLVLVGALAMTQVASADVSARYLDCAAGAWSVFTVRGPAKVYSQFVGTRDGVNRVYNKEFMGSCDDPYCQYSHDVYDDGVLWGSHYVLTDGGFVVDHHAGCS